VFFMLTLFKICFLFWFRIFIVTFVWLSLICVLRFKRFDFLDLVIYHCLWIRYFLDLINFPVITHFLKLGGFFCW
jgi:hypothetical protein